MRILRIFGIVVAVHLAAFVFVFAIPGCRSTTRTASNRQPVVSSETKTLELPYFHRDKSPVSAPAASPVSPVEVASPAGNGSTIVFPGVGGASPLRPGTAEATAAAPEPKPVSGPTHTVVARESLWSIAKKYRLTEKELASANQLRTGTPLRVGQVLLIPNLQVPAAGESVNVPAATFTYRVRAGDSLVSIAKRAGISTAQLKELNQLTNDVVRVGQELVLPATPAAVPAGAPAEAPAKASKPPKPGMTRYVVRSGETLGEIARKHGVPLREIATANNIANPAALRAGAELWIPASKGAQTKAVAEGPAVSIPTAAPTPTPTPANDSPFVTPASDSPVAPAADSPIAPADNPFITPAR